MRISPLVVVKNWIASLVVTALAISPVFSQSTAVNNAPPANYDATYAVPYIRHETDNQNQIILPVSPALPGSVSCVGAACSPAWTVTVNGVATAVTSITGAAGATNIIILLSGATPVIKVGNPVRVSYTGSGNLNAFANRVSYNARPVACSDFTFAAFIDASLSCAPVTPSSQMVFSVIPGARNSQRWNFTNTTSRILWNSPSLTPATSLNGSETDIGGAAATNTYFVGFKTTPATYTYPANDPVCGYTSAWNIRLTYTAPNGFSGNCPITGAAQNQAYASYNNDDTGINGTGNADVLLPPTVTNGNKVCIGNNVNMTFSDATRLNCNPAVAPAPINDKVRWVRVVYGSTDWGPGNTAADNIPNIRVGGVPVTTGTGALSYPGGYFPVSPATTTFGAPDAFGVVQLATPVSGPRGILEAITTSSATGQAVGQRFWVRIDYWNTCNPYDGAGDALNVRKSIENYIEIVSIPPAPTAGVSAAVCNGTTPADFNITGATAGSTVKWYRNVSGSTPKTVGTVGANFATTTANGAGASSITVASAFGGFSNTVADNYIVWATYTASPGGIACESPPVAITRSIREALTNTNMSVRNPTAQCPGSTVTFIADKPASGTPMDISTPQPVGGATEIFWTVPAAIGTLQTGQGTNTITVQLAATPGSGQVSAQWRYATTPVCAATAVNGATYTMLSPPSISSSTPDRTVCETVNTTFGVTATGSGTLGYQWQVDPNTGTFGNVTNGGVYSGATTATLTIANVPFSMNNYKYRCIVTATSGGCSPAATSPTRTLTVRPNPSITTQPPNRVICIGTSTTFNVVAAGQATLTYQWQEDPNTGTFSNITNGGVYSGATTATLTLTNVPVTMTDYRYRVIVNSTTCNFPVTSAGGNLTLQGAQTSISTPSPSSVCAANNLQLNASETFLNGTFVSRAWTGTYDETGPNPLISLSTAQLNALLTDGSGGSRRTALDPIFNSSGLGLNKIGQYVFTLTTTDDNACTSTATITINVGQVDANILYGLTSGGVTQTDLNAQVCSSFDLFLNGNPSGGSGTFVTHSWTKVSGPVGSGAIGALLTNPAIRNPTFNSTVVGTYVLRYDVTDALGCTFTTATGPKDITITVNALPAAANQNPTVCSDLSTPTQATVNLTSLNASINPSAGVTIAWFTGYTAATKTFTGAIATPTAYVVSTGSPTVFARVTDNTTTCPSPATVTYTINPAPVGISKTIAGACSPQTISLDPQTVSVDVAAGGNGVSSTFSWTAAYNGLTTAMPASGTGVIAGTLTNATNTSRNAVFTVTPTSTAGCPGNPFTITVPINPVPTIFDRTTSICSGTAFSITPVNGTPAATTIVPAGTTYTWVISTANANITGASAQATGVATIGQTLTNITNTSQTIIYRVTPKAPAGIGGCTGADFFVTVTVDPTPVIANRTVAVCSGTAFNVAPVNGNPSAATIVPANTTYSWPAPVVTGGMTGGSAATGQTSISQTLVNTSTSPQTATYTVTPKSGDTGLCTGANFTVTVTVNPIPKLSSSLTPPDICSGTFTYTAASLTGGATFTWSRPNVAGINESANSGTNGNISETLTNPTTAPVDVTYTIITTANSCSNTGQDVVVRVNPTPIPNPILGPANVCVGTNPFFYSVTQHSGATYSWEIPAQFTVEAAGGGVVAGGGPGAFTSDYFILLKFSSATPPGGLQIKVREKSADGCIGLENTLTIVAANSPPTVPIAGGTSFCKFEKGVVFSVPQNASSTFTWSVNSGATIVGPSAGTNLYQIIVDFNSSPSAQIDVTETNITGCPSNYPSLIVSLLDAPVITPTTGSICSGDQPSSVINLNTQTSIPSTFDWFVKNITGTITGAFVNDTGTGPLEHFPPLKNVSGSNATIVYRVTPTSSSAPFCIGVPVDITVTIKPEPVMTAIGAQDACPVTFVNGAVSFPFASNVSGATFNWTNSNTAIGSAAASGTGNISFTTADNLTGADITSTINVTATANGCTSTGANAASFVFTLKPRPVITSVLPDIIVCPGDQIGPVTFAGNAGGETFNWTNDNTAIGLTGAGSGAIAAYTAPTNVTGSDRIANIMVTATKNSCAGPSRTFRIVIHSKPAGTGVTRAAQCSNVAFSVSSNNITNGMGATSTYTWVRNALPAGLTVITAGTGTGNIAETLRNLSGTTLSASYNVTPTSADGCVGDPYVVTVPINSEPVGSPITRAAQCSGMAFSVSADNISNGMGASSTYAWVRSPLPAGLTQIAAGSGTGAIAETLQNLTGGSLNATYTVTPTSSAGCVGDPYVITVPINPQPVGADITRAAQCSNTAFSVSADNVTNGVTGSTFTWTRNTLPAGLTIVTAGTGNGAIAETLRNLTSGQLSATYNVTATAASCVSASYVVTVPINPEPVGAAIMRDAQCSNVPFSVSADNVTNGVLGSTFTWVRNTLPAGLGLVTAGTGTGAIAETLRNTTSASLNATYIVVPTSGAGCVGASYVVAVPINPEPVGANMTASAQCSNTTFSIDPNNVTNGLGLTSTYTWVRNALPAGLTQVTAGTGSGMISERLQNLTSSQLTAVYVITPTSSSGCVGATYNITVPVNPQPVGSDVTRAAQCSNVSFSVSAVNISNGLGATSSYTWVRNTLPAGLVLVTPGTGTGSTITETIRNLSGGQLTATYVVTPRSADNCVGDTYVVSVPIDSEPVGSDITRAAECSSVGFNVSPDNISNGMGGTSTYTWVRQALPAGLTVAVPGTGTGTISETLRNVTSGQLSAKYTVTPRSAAGCNGATYVITIPVNPEPVGANITRSAQCSGVAFSVSADNITNGLGATSTFTWSRNPLSAGLTVVTAGTGTGAIAETLQNLTAGQLSASYTVTATSASGCASSTYIVTVPINPEPVGANITRAAQCSNVAFSVSADNITNGLGPTSTFAWVRDALPAGLTQVIGGSGSGAIAETLRNLTSGSLNAVYTVTPTSGSGCVGATYKITVPINPEPVGANIITAAQCSNVAFSLSADNITNGVVGATFTWVRQALPAGLTVISGGTGSGSIDETLRNLTGGTLNAVYRVTPSVGGCTGATYDITVPVNPEPVGANITRTAQCSNVAFSVSANNITNGVAGLTFTWVRQALPPGLTEVTAGTGSGAIAETLENLSSVQLSATYVVTPTSGAGCVGTAYVVTVPVNPQPVGADITRAAQCSNVAFSVSADNITNGLGASSTYTWVRNALPVGLTVVTAGSGTGAIAETLRNLTGGTLNATYTVTPRSSANCNGNTYVVTVPISPEPVGADITRAAQCSNVAFSLSADNITNGVTGTTFTWVRQALPVGLTQVTAGTGSGAIAETLRNLTATSLDAKYTVTPTTGGCVGVAYVVTVPVNPEPVGAGITRATQCSNQAFSVSADNVTNGVIGSTFTWVRDNLPVGLSVVTAGTGSGPIAETIRNITGGVLSATYKVTPTSGAGCVGAVYTITVPINPEPVGGNITRTAQCSDVPFSIDPNNITNGMGASTNFTWVRDPLPAGLTQVAAGSGSGLINETLQNLTSGQLNAIYRVTPTATNGCVGDVYTVTVPINPEPVGANITRAAQCSNVPFSVSAINITNNLGGTSTYTWVRNALPAGLTVVASGTGSGGTINETLRNVTGGTLNATYTITPTSADNCVGTAYVVTVPIDSEPVGANITRAPECSGVTFSVSADNITNGMGATSTYSWVRQTLPAGLTVVVSGSGNGPISEMLRNTSSGQLNVQYVVTPRSAGGCVGATYIVTIPINPEPLGANFTRANQCSNVAFSVSADNISNGLGATSSYTWVRNPLPGGLTQVVGGDGTGLIEETLRNLSGVTLTASYVVTPTSAAGCVGGSYTIFVPIDSEPVGADITRAQACSNQSFTVSADNITNGMSGVTTYTWVRQTLPAGLTVVTAGTGNGNITETLANLSSGQLNAVYEVTPKSTPGCFGVPYFITVPVNPEPVGANITRAAQCSDSPFSVSADNITNGVIGVTFTWVRQTLPAGLVVVTNGDGTGDIEETLKNTTGSTLSAVYRVTPTAGVCPGNTYDIAVPINGEPVMANNLNQERCSDAPYGRTLTTNGVSEPASSYDIEVVSIATGLTGTRTVGMVGTGLPDNAIFNDSYTNTGTVALKVVYRVTPNGATCIGDPKLIEFTIHPEPVLGVPAPTPICSGSKIGVLLSTNGSSVGANSYRITAIEYSNGGPFTAAAPAFFTFPGTNEVSGNSGDASLIFDDEYKNLGAAVVTVRYTIVPVSATNAGSPTGCEGDPSFVSVDVRPEPDMDNSLSPAAICSGLTIVSGNPGFLLRSEATSVAASTFIIRSITNLSGLTAGPSNAGTGSNKPANAINNDTWINTSAAAASIVYKIAPVSAAGCIGQDEDITVTVNPSPAVKPNLDRIVCSTTITGLVLQDNSPTSITAASYDIISVNVGATPIPAGATVGGLTAAGTNAGLGVTTNINRVRDDRFTNNTNDRIIVSYTIVGISAAGCRGPASVVNVTIEPPVISASTILDNTICSGDAVDITFASPTYSNGDPTNPIVTFSYTTLPSSVSGVSVGNALAEGAKITDILVNNTNAPITVHYRITPRAAAAANSLGCDAVPTVQDVPVTVEPKPKINTLANKTVCAGTSANLLLASPTVPTTGTIDIMVTATADPEVGGYSNGVAFANNATLGDILTNTASVTKYVTYHLEVRNVIAGVPNCTTPPIDVVVGVTPRPVFTPALANFAICSGDSFNAIPINTDTETATPGSTVITWSVVANPNVAGESPGAGNAFSQVLFNNTNNKVVVQYTINATNVSNSPSCAATPMPLNITVYPNPRATNIPSSINVCNNGQLPGNPTVPFTIAASTVAGLNTTFDWPTPDNGGNPDMGPVSSGTNATTIPQVFVNNGASQGTITYTIKAHLTMAAGDNPLIDVGQGLDDRCDASVESTMVVNVAPPVDGNIFGYDIEGNEAADIYLCKGSTPFTYIEPIGLPQLKVEYTENGTPKTLTNLSGQKAIPGVPTVTTTYVLTKVTDRFNCSVNLNKTLTVHVDQVDPTATISNNEGCSPLTVTFKHNQIAGTNYQWKFADGPDDAIYNAATTELNKTVTHVYTTLSTTSTTLLKPVLEMRLDTTKFQDGCRKRVQFDVKIFPTINASFIADKVAMCSDETVSLTQTSQGSNLTHRWWYRVQGSTAEIEVKNTTNANFTIPNVSTQNPLIYELVYRVKNLQCQVADVVKEIRVYRGVDAHFSHTVPTLWTIGDHSQFTITNDSEPIDGSDFAYEWSFGADATPASANDPGPTFAMDYATPGPKDVRLVVTNIAAASDPAGALVCADEFTETINIAVPPLIAEFKAIPLEACFPTDITVTENKATGDTWEWRVLDNAGTAGQSNAELPVFKIPSPGKYTVELTTRNSFTGDQKTATQEIIVYDLPMASFDFRPGLVYVPDTELLTYNFSDGATGYLWDFGDGATSDEKEPKHTYKIEGVYDITLIAMNDHGNDVVCTDTLVRKVTAKQGGVTRVPNAFTPNPNGPSSSAGGAPGANSFNDVFLPQVKGAEEFNMQVFDRWGNLVFESNNSNVGWDGYDKDGDLLPAGVYVYKLTLRLSDGQRTTQVGDITMIR